MSNITVNTDCLETVIEMINRCAADLDSDVTTLIDNTFAPFVNVGLCTNIGSILSGQCRKLDNQLASSSIRIANFLTDYIVEEKELEAYCDALPQESKNIESMLSTTDGIFNSESEATSIENIDHGTSISNESTNAIQDNVLNNLNITSETLSNIDNEKLIQEQQMQDNYDIKNQQLENINNNSDTNTQELSHETEKYGVRETPLYSMENTSQQELEKIEEYLKTKKISLSEEQFKKEGLSGVFRV